MSEELLSQLKAKDEHIKALEGVLRRALPVVRLSLYRKLAADIEKLLKGENHVQG